MPFDTQLGIYIPRALKKKIDRSSHPLKKELLLCLLDLSEEFGIEGESCEWINSIDRGGLNHVGELKKARLFFPWL